jgi:hypothetical protein
MQLLKIKFGSSHSHHRALQGHLLGFQNYVRQQSLTIWDNRLLEIPPDVDKHATHQGV